MKGLKLHIVSRKASDTKSDVALFLRINKKGTSAKHYLGLSVPADRWNKEEQRIELLVRPKGSDEAAKTRRKLFNDLNNLNTKINDAYSRAEELYKLSEDAFDLKRLLEEDKKGGQRKRVKTQSVSSSLRLWVETHEEDTKRRKIASRAASTIQNYKSFEKFLNRFRGLHNNSLRAFDESFYTGWIDELNEEYEFAPNTIGTKIKLLKTFLNWCVEQRFDVNLEFRRYKKMSEEKFFVTLTKDDLKAIAAVEGYYPLVRDAFLISCYTGLRFSDLKNIKPSNVQGEKILVRIKKTRKPLSVHIHSTLRPLVESVLCLQKTVMSNPVMNKQIKEIAKRAGIDELVRFEHSGKDEEKHKYELITMHTGRRSFITNMIREGKPHSVVMAATGITQLKTLQKYIHLTDEDVRKAVEATFAD